MPKRKQLAKTVLTPCVEDGIQFRSRGAAGAYRRRKRGIERSFVGAPGILRLGLKEAQGMMWHEEPIVVTESGFMDLEEVTGKTYLPTPEEIQEHMKRFSESWTHEERCDRLRFRIPSLVMENAKKRFGAKDKRERRK